MQNPRVLLNLKLGRGGLAEDDDMHMDGTAGLVAQSLPSGMDRVELKDPVENIAANLVRQAAAKTNDLACDRTITSVVLAQGLINESVKVVAAGANPVLITCGMEKTTRALLTLMKLVVPFIMIQTPLL